VEGDVRDFSAKEFKGVDLLAGGVGFVSVAFSSHQTPPLTPRLASVHLN
jgi:hypothetical protein